MPGSPSETLYSSNGNVYFHAGIRLSRKAGDAHIYLSAFYSSFAAFCDDNTVFGCGARSNCLDLGAAPVNLSALLPIYLDLECWIAYNGGFFPVSSSPSTPDNGYVGTLTVTAA